MKKMIALLIALLMLALPFASAETALTVSDPVVVMNMGGEETRIDLAGLAVIVAAGDVDGVAALRLEIAGDGNKLYGVSANVLSDRVLVTGDGMSSVYFIQVPADVSGMTRLEIPEIDLEPIMEALINSVEIDGDTIRVPYTAVNDLLAALAPSIESVEVPGVDVSQFTDIVNQLKESNSGINLEGSYTESDAGMNVSAKGFMVQNGEASPEALFDAKVEIGEGVNFTFDAQGASMHAGLNGDKFNIGGSADGSSFDLSGTVAFGESDMQLTALDGGNAIDVQNLTAEQLEKAQGELMSNAYGLIGYFLTKLAPAA